jgi:hypothetical protein
MKFSDVMFSDLTDDQVRLLSAEERALWIIRPRDPLPRSRIFMYIRVALIAITFVYFKGEAKTLALVLGCYELAYFNSAKEKLSLQYMLERERYAERVRELESGPDAA